LASSLGLIARPARPTDDYTRIPSKMMDADLTWLGYTARDRTEGTTMITPEEIVDMTDLTPEEVAAIGEHEHLSEICAAAALADYLMHQRDGPRTIRRMIREDMRDALRAGNAAHARELYAALKHFVATHPEAAQGRP
jgi:hypothetical protein